MNFRKQPPTEPGIYEAQTLLGRRRIVVFIPGAVLIAFHKDWNVTNREYQPSAYLWGDRIDLDRTPVPGEVAKCCRELRTYMAKRKPSPWLHNLTAKICDWVDSLTPPREEPLPLPRRFTAICIAANYPHHTVIGCLMPDGVYHWTGGEGRYGKAKQNVVDGYLKDIHWIDGAADE